MEANYMEMQLKYFNSNTLISVQTLVISVGGKVTESAKILCFITYIQNGRRCYISARARENNDIIPPSKAHSRLLPQTADSRSRTPG
jgi:hypothetical protein